MILLLFCSLCVAWITVKQLFEAKFSVPSKIGHKFAFFWGGEMNRNVNFVFWTPKRHILARNDVI